MNHRQAEDKERNLLIPPLSEDDIEFHKDYKTLVNDKSKDYYEATYRRL